MSVFRNHHNSEYRTISVEHLRDTNLSWGAKGMLSFMLSNADTFDYSVQGLANCSVNGVDGVKSILKELKEKGYLAVTAIRDRGKIVDWEYDVYEHPQVISPDAEKPHVEKPHMEKPHVENPLAKGNNKLLLKNKGSIDIEQEKKEVSIQDKSLIDTKNSQEETRTCESENLLFEEGTEKKPKKTAKEKKEDERLKREDKFREQLEQYKTSCGGEYDDLMVDDFFNYWSEPNASGSKMKWELQQTFDIKRRLVTWSSRNFNSRNNGNNFGGTQQRFGNSGTQRPLTDIERARLSYQRVTDLSNSIPDPTMF